MYLTRLAQIAEELENEGLTHDAGQLDDAVYQMSPSAKKPETSIQTPQNTFQQPSVMDVLSEFLHSAVNNVQQSGLTPDQLLSGQGKGYVAQAADTASLS